MILFDQRGCGKSDADAWTSHGPRPWPCRERHRPPGPADINPLRDALGITGRMHVFGGSWGSTLALVYAIRHPEHVASLILRGIFLGTREDLLYMYQGNAAVLRRDALRPDASRAPT